MGALGDVEAPAVKLIGSVLFLLSLGAVSPSAALALFGGTIRLGGALGLLVADYLHGVVQHGRRGSARSYTTLIVSVYLVSTFTMAKFG